jgi:hypothetical protein
VVSVGSRASGPGGIGAVADRGVSAGRRLGGAVGTAVTPRPTWTVPTTVSLFVTIIAIFGPYTAIIRGVRTEQLFVYGMVLVGLPLLATTMRLTRFALGALLSLGLLGVVGLVGALVPVLNTTPYQRGSLLPGLDNYALPLAALVLTQLWLASGVSRTALLQHAARATVVLMCLNALVSVASIRVDLTGVLGRFWAPTLSDGTVAQNAAQMGRLSGIFNQPSEAGILYGIALFAAIYLWRDQAARLAVPVALIVVGGALTVSKIFLLVAVPVGAWQLFRASRGRARKLVALGAVVLIAAGAGQANLLPAWTGISYLTRLLSPTGGVIDFYTASRLGERSSLLPVAEAVLHASPLFGLGAGGLLVPYDNGWIEALVVAGLFGVVVYTACLVVLVRAWRAHRPRDARTSRESAFSGALVTLAVAASLGIPALTANRVAAMLWILLGLTVLAPRPRPSDPVE